MPAEGDHQMKIEQEEPNSMGQFLRHIEHDDGSVTVHVCGPYTPPLPADMQAITETLTESEYMLRRINK